MCVCMSLCVLAGVRTIRGTQAELKKYDKHELDTLDEHKNTILHIIVHRIATNQADKATSRTPRVTIRLDAVG